MNNESVLVCWLLRITFFVAEGWRNNPLTTRISGQTIDFTYNRKEVCIKFIESPNENFLFSHKVKPIVEKLFFFRGGKEWRVRLKKNLG